MKKSYFLIVWMAIFYSPTELTGQGKCKVLMPGISLHYQGHCKKGLANGYGEAYGVDTYNGYFKKGLPDGEGTYKWAKGELYTGHWRKGLRHGMGSFTFKQNGKDTTLAGLWVDDKFKGKGEATQNYLITYKNNIGRVSVSKVGDGREIKFKFLRHGGEIPVSDLLLYGDSGIVMNERAFQGFDNVDFPFVAKITFSVMNDFGAASLSCELRFKIMKPGSYEFHIFP